MQIIEFLHYLILIYVGISVSYLIFFTLIGLYPRKIKKTFQKKQHKFVVFIPAYKEDQVIYNVAYEVLKQNYPKDLFEIIVIADSL